MSQPKVTLFEMADAVGHAAFSARGHVERWDRGHADEPLPPTHPWIREARVYENAHLTLSLMALDEDASRKFIGSLIEAHGADSKLLVSMITGKASPKTTEDRAAA